MDGATNIPLPYGTSVAKIGTKPVKVLGFFSSSMEIQMVGLLRQDLSMNNFLLTTSDFVSIPMSFWKPTKCLFSELLK